MEQNRVGIYCRVSTKEQTTQNQLLDLRRYCEARGWRVVEECVDNGVSGSKGERPALSQVLELARKRKIDILVIWRLDRLFRSLKHLILTTEELAALGVSLVSYSESIDLTTPQGELILGVLGALAQFERSLIVERVRSGLRRAVAQGKVLGRPKVTVDPATVRGLHSEGRTLCEIASVLGVGKSTVHRLISQKPCTKLTSESVEAEAAKSDSQKHLFLGKEPKVTESSTDDSAFQTVAPRKKRTGIISWSVGALAAREDTPASVSFGYFRTASGRPPGK